MGSAWCTDHTTRTLLELCQLMLWVTMVVRCVWHMRSALRTSWQRLLVLGLSRETVLTSPMSTCGVRRMLSATAMSSPQQRRVFGKLLHTAIDLFTHIILSGSLFHTRR